MKNLIIASKNKGKLKEFAEMLADFPFNVVSMEEAGVTEDIDETGITFEANSMIKAMEVHRLTGSAVMADDSGLEVDYLNGAPGVYSARFAGVNATDEERNNKLLDMLSGVPDEKRSARFVCAISVVLSEAETFTVKGVCEGQIGYAPDGGNGFGYDPLFYMPEFGMTTAAMDPMQKHEVSHRGKALRLMVAELRKRLDMENGK